MQSAVLLQAFSAKVQFFFGGIPMTVRFTSVRDIREFVGLATLQSFPVHVADGDGSTADAKCFMEMFTLDFTAPLNVEISGEENKSAFASAAKKFLV